MEPAAPLILTAAFDLAAGAAFQALRDRYFPPHLNIVPAHLTLFHKLSGDELAAIKDVLTALCKTFEPLPFTVSGARFLGRGVALSVTAAGLAELQANLVQRWRDWLSPQDRQPFHPHVTIQNKTDPAAARAFYEQISAKLPLITGSLIGLDLWHYRGGPWELARRFDFG